MTVSIYLAILSLLYVTLSIRALQTRRRLKIAIGDPGWHQRVTRLKEPVAPAPRTTYLNGANLTPRIEPGEGEALQRGLSE